jgi:hypothetical protein
LFSVKELLKGKNKTFTIFRSDAQNQRNRPFTLKNVTVKNLLKAKAHHQHLPGTAAPAYVAPDLCYIS